MAESQIIDTGWDAVLNSELKEKAPYYARVIQNIDNGQGYWQYQEIGVFDRTEHMLGSYTRNYSSIMRAFHPFKLHGEWLALYSKHYTATRLMRLPSCEDIGGEEPFDGGFCPVDYYVPTLSDLEFRHDANCPRHPEIKNYQKACTCNLADPGRDIWTFPERVHGFVAGCVWGDDSSWKIQYLDLTDANNGLLKRDERFGYIELGHETLEKAIDLDGDYLTISVLSRFTIDGNTFA